MRKANIFLSIICLVLIVTQSALIQNRNITITPNATHLLYTHDNTILFVAAQASLAVFSGVNGTKLADLNLDNHTGISSLALSISDTILAVGFTDGFVAIYNPNGEILSMTKPEKMLTATSTITSLCFTNDEKLLIYGSENDEFYIRNLETS